MITNEDWDEIYKYVERRLSQRGTSFSQGIVIKRDEHRSLVWLREFGDQAIPVIGFNYEIRYRDTLPDGTVKVRHVKVKPHVPLVGEEVLVAKHLNSRRLPKCVGVLQGVNFEELAGIE